MHTHTHTALGRVVTASELSHFQAQLQPLPKYNIVVSHKKLRVKNNRFPYAVCKLHREPRGENRVEEQSNGELDEWTTEEDEKRKIAKR